MARPRRLGRAIVVLSKGLHSLFIPEAGVGAQMTPIQRIGLELRKITQELKYSAVDKRAYMFYHEDFADFLQHVDRKVGLVGGVPHNPQDDQVFQTDNGFEFYLDSKDWEDHDDLQVETDPVSGQSKKISLPEMGEPRLVVRKDGHIWKGVASEPQSLYKVMGIH